MTVGRVASVELQWVIRIHTFPISIRVDKKLLSSSENISKIKEN